MCANGSLVIQCPEMTFSLPSCLCNCGRSSTMGTAGVRSRWALTRDIYRQTRRSCLQPWPNQTAPLRCRQLAIQNMPSNWSDEPSRIVFQQHLKKDCAPTSLLASPSVKRLIRRPRDPVSGANGPSMTVRSRKSSSIQHLVKNRLRSQLQVLRS